MDSKIFVVYGSTGEYSDRTEWAVCAYRDRDKAEAHVLAAKEWYQKMGCKDWDFHRRHDDDGPKNPFDPCMEIDYTGTVWYLGEVTLRTALPTESKPIAFANLP